MDKSAIRKEITTLINSIKEHSDKIGDKDTGVQSELEALFNKIEKLHQHTIIYNHLNSFPETQKDPEVLRAAIKSEINIPVEPAVDLTNLFGTELPPPAEKPKTEKKSESKLEQKQNVPVSKIQKPKISDLPKAIGINDKFQFANELFSGNMQEYHIAIQQLNASETLESAMDYFLNLQQLYEWNLENETVKRLLDLVDRKYS
jgi:hypothetical protein